MGKCTYRRAGKIVAGRKKRSVLILTSLMMILNTGADTAWVSAEDQQTVSFTYAENAEICEEPEPLYESYAPYRDYYEKYKDESRPGSAVTVSGCDFLEADCESYDTGEYTDLENGETRSGVLICKSEKGRFSYEINVPETGIYSLEISYCPIVSDFSEIELSLSIDGEIPFDSAERIRLSKVYRNECDIRKDSAGNEIRPVQVQTEMWLCSPLKDPDGLYNEPLIFYFEKGRHTAEFDVQRGSLAVEYIKLCPLESLCTYDEYVSSVNSAEDIGNMPSEPLRTEGEAAVYKSDPSLYPTYDNTVCSVSPSDPEHILYNTIGKGGFKKSGQSMTWSVVVPCDGWYRLGIMARQDEMRGFFSNRRIYIDGKVLCEDMQAVRFNYSTDFEMTEVKTLDNRELYIYLTADESHSITMEAVPGVIGGYIQRLDDITEELNDHYRKIVMITGPVPDTYTDYYVHEKIPGITEDFARLADELLEVKGDIEELSGTGGSEAAILENLAVILDSCSSSPLKIPKYLSQIKDYLTSVSAWMCNYRDQPLEIDYIELAAKGVDFNENEPGFFEKLAYGFRRFTASFSEDYTADRQATGEDTINVWVQLGREQVQVIRELTKSEFVSESGVSVSVNPVSGGITEASLAGKGPDAVLFMKGDDVINLGSRGLLADISESSGYDNAVAQYPEEALVPYSYEDGVYGLPLTRTWAMMFYRKDVLAELGFSKPPETWQELRDMLPALQRNYMSAGLILPGANTEFSVSQTSPATESGHTFAALILQRGLNYYNEDKTKTVFDTNEAVDAFGEWTDFYTKYGLAQQYDSFSRFRTGEYPVVIADYTFYNQLTEAAPEIRGTWDFCFIPGTEREDGSISHAVNASGTGAVVFDKEDDRKTEAAWEYIKWFSSEDVQTEYARQTEGLLGRMGRYAPASPDVLKQLSWSSEELGAIEEAMAEIREIPIIPASYAVTRNIMNAFRDTVNNGANGRDTLMWYNRDINDEIARKRKVMGGQTDD